MPGTALFAEELVNTAMASAWMFWENRYDTAASHDARNPHLLVEQLCSRLTPASVVLDLGCGGGADSLYLAAQGHRMISCDFAANALRQFADDACRLGVTQRRLDMTELPYPFGTGFFDAVYARLSLHYFPRELTFDIIGEISRVLRPGGTFLSLFNSFEDKENGQGVRIEDRYYELAPGSRKRFFTTVEAEDLFGPWFSSVSSSYVPAANDDQERKFVRILAVR